MRFTRPADVNVYTVLQVSVNPRLDPGDASIQAAVRAVYATLGAGELVAAPRSTARCSTCAA